MVFQNKPQAKLTGKLANGDNFSFTGVTTLTTTPENAARQINKLLNIGGKSFVADYDTERVITEEAIEE